MSQEEKNVPVEQQRLEKEQIEDMGSVYRTRGAHAIHCLTVIGQVEGHVEAPQGQKTTKYEHVIPQLVAVQEDPAIEGLLVLLNTVGGDVEAGLALAELIASISKPSAAVVLGFLGVLALSVFELVPLFKGLLLMLVALLLTRILTLDEIRRRFPLDIWLVVGGALAIADQLEKSGLAKLIADWLMGEFNGSSPIIAFIGIYLFTLVLTELMSNNAAAALAFPMGYQLALSMDVATMPFILAVLFGASSSFIMPYGYQTNLMVYGPGGYRLTDYLRLGVPLSLLTGLVTIPVILWFWPL